MKQIIFILSISFSLFASNIKFEVLGSGGPEVNNRASTSYLLWIDNKARLMIDMGSGSMLRFKQSGAKIKDLEAIVLTHLHIDHSVDLPAFVMAGYFSNRTKSLDIIAPDKNQFFPSTTQFLNLLFGKHGVYRYMQDVLTKHSDSFEIIPINIKVATTRKYKDFSLDFIRVHHGIVPALAVRIRVQHKIIVISGDTNNQNHKLENFAKNANLFIAHMAITQNANKYAKDLHMTPKMIATIANKAQVQELVLTHRMSRTIGHESQILKIIKKIYKGKVVFANDKMMFAL